MSLQSEISEAVAQGSLEAHKEVYDILAAEIGLLKEALDERWPAWCEETMRAFTDDAGNVSEQVSVPIRAAITLINRTSWCEGEK